MIFLLKTAASSYNCTNKSEYNSYSNNILNITKFQMNSDIQTLECS